MTLHESRVALTQVVDNIEDGRNQMIEKVNLVKSENYVPDPRSILI